MVPGHDIWLDNALDFVSAALGLLGMALLAVPAFAVDKYAKLLLLLRKLPNEPEQEKNRERVQRELMELRDGWTRGKSLCLLGANLFTGLAFLVLLFKAAKHMWF
jgi:hypothetical protein